MVLAVSRELNGALLVLADERPALSRCAARRIRDRQEGEDGAEDECGGVRALTAAEWVATFVVVVSDGGHDEVRAVCDDDAALREAGAWVGFLYGRVYAQYGDECAEGEVEADKEPVEAATGAGEEGEEDAGEGDGGDVHACGGPYEDPLPEV